MQWIKEVELVDSVDELISSSSTRGISMPNFEVLDARNASALNKIIHNSQFKRRISLEEQQAQKEDRFLRGRQIAYLIYEQFRVTGTHDSLENYTNLFTHQSRSRSIQPQWRRVKGKNKVKIWHSSLDRPRVGLLDVSRLLGLTLRHFVPVCCSYRDSLTRWRLALVQEVVKFSCAPSSRLVLHVMACARWFQIAFE